MLFDANGNYIRPGGVERTYEWSPLVDSESLPSWLTLIGTSAIQTVNGVDGDRGFARFQTKSATPTSGDSAGVRAGPASIDTAKFREIGLFVYGWAIDTNDATIVSPRIDLSDGSTNGAIVSNNQTAEATRLLVRPSALKDLAWDMVPDSNGTRRKNFGLLIRPATREVWVTLGDPAEGCGVIGYDKGNWLDTISALSCSVFTLSSAQRYMEFSRIKLRLVST